LNRLVYGSKARPSSRSYTTDTTIPLGFRTGILVDGAAILEIKAVASLLPAHEAQLLTYLRMGRIRVGLLMNFHAKLLKNGLQRFVV
jgi:GxxExxY protein